MHETPIIIDRTTKNADKKSSEKKVVDYEKEKDRDFEEILKSNHPRVIVVAGPGTGKSYLFKKVIEKELRDKKSNFLALTFVGKLSDELADNLAGLAETMTIHGFARRLVLNERPKGWEYYPKIADIIQKDLDIKGLGKTNTTSYGRRTRFYKAIGEDDVVRYAVEICKNDLEKIPEYDLILIDEYQDFNEIESEFIDILTTKNKILIVGDDDQALYGFRDSSPTFIREKFDKSNTYFESHTLRFCFRCTKVLVSAFKDVVNHFDLNNKGGRIKEKDYICFLPDKNRDSDLNEKIILLKDAKIGQIPGTIKNELSKILDKQKVKSVLIIGEARTCKPLLAYIAKRLKDFGFKNVDYNESNNDLFSLNQRLVAGYKILSKGNNDILAWRLIMEEIPEAERKRIISNNYDNPVGLMDALPEEFKKTHKKNSEVLGKIINEVPSKVKLIADSSIETLGNKFVLDRKQDRHLLINQLNTEHANLPRPLINLDITVCSILGSKGLGADVVFLVGFDQGKLPLKKDPVESEIYQMLVALTRAEKRLYLVNTINRQVSQFIDCINKDLYEVI